MVRELTRHGICRACGQVRLVKAASLEEADTKATAQCICSEGKEDRYYQQLTCCIDKLCGPHSNKRGFASVEERIIEMIKEVTLLILLGKIERATFNLEGSVIYINKKNGKVKIKRTLLRTIEGDDAS